jgi:ribosomal protein S18 acetylase RimI-like enzyme
MTTLAPMGEEGCATFVEASVTGYANDNVAAGRWTVGFLWFATLSRGNTKAAYVYQLEVHPEFRRRGHARAAFEAMEAIVVTMGLATIGLHVFGHAPGAQALYSSLGYQVTGINMQKRLPVTGTRDDA